MAVTILKNGLTEKEKDFFRHTCCQHYQAYDFEILEREGADFETYQLDDWSYISKSAVDTWRNFFSSKTGNLEKDFELLLGEGKNCGRCNLFQSDFDTIKKFHITYDDVKTYREHPYENGWDTPVYNLDTEVRNVVSDMRETYKFF